MNSTIFQGYVTLTIHTTTVFTVDAQGIIHLNTWKMQLRSTQRKSYYVICINLYQILCYRYNIHIVCTTVLVSYTHCLRGVALHCPQQQQPRQRGEGHQGHGGQGGGGVTTVHVRTALDTALHVSGTSTNRIHVKQSCRRTIGEVFTISCYYGLLLVKTMAISHLMVS